MNYTQKELFEFMNSERPVKVTCTDGEIFSGRCWAYSAGENLEEDGIDEPSLEIENTMLYLHEIKKVEYMRRF